VIQELTYSNEYKQVLLSTHAQNKGWGNGGKYAAEPARAFANMIGASTILDYGCGQGVLRERLRDQFYVSEFDPGIVGKDAPPEVADLVVCTDVLEHIEPEYIHETLKHLRSLARKGLYAVISLSPANLVLSDGRNAHLIVEPPLWWLERLRQHGFKIQTYTIPKGLHVWAF
jgi:2-polyprenyl-3-methyl-5-hydroxy-6-metoxy-1,4-benzoquinol methylase